MKKEISKNIEIEALKKKICKLEFENRIRIIISILVNVLDKLI